MKPLFSDAKVLFSTDSESNRHTDFLYTKDGVQLASRFNGHLAMDTCVMAVLRKRELAAQGPDPKGAA